MFPENGARRPAEQLLAAAVPQDDPVRGIDGEDRLAAPRDPIEGFRGVGHENASVRTANIASTRPATGLRARADYTGRRRRGGRTTVTGPARNVDEPERHAAKDPFAQRVAALASDDHEIGLHPIRLARDRLRNRRPAAGRDDPVVRA